MNQEVSKKLGLVIPLILFVALIPLFFFAMGEDKEEIPSPLIGKSIPDFFLPSLDGDCLDFQPLNNLLCNSTARQDDELPNKIG